MEEVRAFLLVASNVGGFGLMSYVLWKLHTDSIDKFLKALSETRGDFNTLIREERTLHVTDRVNDRSEQRGLHAELVTRLERIESEVRAVKDLMK